MSISSTDRDLTVGIEFECHGVDVTGRTSNRAYDLVKRYVPPVSGFTRSPASESVKHQLEVATVPFGVRDTRHILPHVRGSVEQFAGNADLLPLFCGLPLTEPLDGYLPGESLWYQQLADRLGEVHRSTISAGIHVHVGTFDDPELRLAVSNLLSSWQHLFVYLFA
jgi:gamma-glutamyl:cysteine ligase YbdK (ATP-grasp superfamily)